MGALASVPCRFVRTAYNGNTLPDVNLPNRALTRTLGTVTFSPLDPSAQIACTDHAEVQFDLLFRR